MLGATLALRLMTANDIDAVVALESDTFSTGWSRDTYLRELANPTARYVVLTATGEGDEQLLGFGGLWLVVDQAHVVTVAVIPSARGQGYGSLLVQALLVLAQAHEVTDVTLEVRESNEAARRLYRGYGFAEVGLRPRYYDNREDAIIMTTEPIVSDGYARRLARRREALEERFPGVVERFEKAVDAS